MNYEDLKAGIETAPLKSRVALEQLLLYTTMGGTVKPEFEEYLEGAQTYRDFFNNIYADPARKNSTVWAEWAKLMRKSWLSCFKILSRQRSAKMMSVPAAINGSPSKSVL